MSVVTVDIYPSGIGEVYNGGTIPTTLSISLIRTDWERAEASKVAEDFAQFVTARRWPPAWFGSIRSSRTDTAARTKEILRAEFGRDDHR